MVYIVIIHCWEEGVLENTPFEAICTRPEGRGVLIAEGGIFSNSSWLEAVYCHSFFQSGGVLEITLQTAGVYWQYIKSIHSRPIYKNALDIWIKFCPKKEHIYSDCIIGYHEACNPVQECRTRFVNDKLKALSKRLNALIASKKSLTTTLSIDSVISFSVL